jgi:hypothetical protein
MWNSMLDDSPTVRASEVARARDLIRDVNYPPRETIERISRLLAIKWLPEPEEYEE